MAFVPTPNTAMVALNYDWKGQKVNNTLWFENGGTPFDEASLTGLTDGVNIWARDELMPQLSERIVYRGCIAYAQDSESAIALNAPVSPTPGGVATDSVVNNVTWCVKFNTIGRGKSFRGRNYIPGIPIASITDNEIDLAFASNIIIAYSAILTLTELVPYAWVVVSHFTAGAPRASGLVSAILSVNYSDLVADSQRRRLPNRGS